MIKMFRSLSFVFVIIALASCTKEKVSPKINFNYSFYPLALTKVWLYNVDSTHYSFFNGTTISYKFQIKDSVANTFTDATNRLAYRVERYVKKPNEILWKYQKTISRTVTTRAAEELIDNKIYTRLVFPPILGATWNANTKNDLLKNEFEITETLDTYTQNNLNFNNTLISYFEDTNLIREDVITHIYADAVGLISAEVTAVDLDITTAKIKDGYISKMKLISFK